MFENFCRRVFSFLPCCKYNKFDEDKYETSLLKIQEKKLGAHEIEVLFDLVLTWSKEILASMDVKDGNPESLQAAKRWFEIKVTAVKGIWWPDCFGVQYEIYSDAVRKSSYFLSIIDEKSSENIVSWQRLSKEITLKHIQYCMRRKKKASVFWSCLKGFSFEKFVTRVDMTFFKRKYLDYQFFSEMKHA